MNILVESIYQENFDKIKELLINNPKSVNEKDDKGIYMSLLAAKTGNINIVKYIVEYSMASMDIEDNNGRDMLFYASQSGNLATCRYLVEKVGLSPVKGDKMLITPIDIAVENKFYELKEYYEGEIGCKYEELYRNPVRKGFFADPSVIRVKDKYYMVNSSFVYFPCIPISESKDMINWKIIGYAINNPEWAAVDSLEGGRGYWAPDISYYDGKFYITATYRMNDGGNVSRKQIIVSSQNPEGPYSKPIIIEEDGIDPSLFTDDDGKHYMLLNRGARILPLSDDFSHSIGEAKLLYYGDNKRASEGPHMLKKDGYYYLFQAEGGTGQGHMITVSRSRKLYGRYEPCPYNPIMRQNNENAAIQRCGHGKPVQTDDGNWYIFYLCGRKLDGKYSILGRETALDPIRWTEDGWPIVNGLKGPSVLQKRPVKLLPEELNNENILKPEKFIDNFDEKWLSNEWIFPRSPEMDGILLESSHVGIKSSAYDLCSIKAKNILLRRQTNFSFSIEAKMMNPDIYPGQDAGITCYYDENTFLKFGIFAEINENGKTILYADVKEYIDGYVENDEDEKIIIEGTHKYIYLKVVTDRLSRTFYIGYDGNEYKKVKNLSNVYYLCDEGLNKGKRFTGAMAGLYANTGDESQGTYYAWFDYFSYMSK